MTLFDDIVVTPVYGSLSHQYPSTMPYHSYGTLIGLRPTPPQFYSQQEPVNAEQNTNARHQYWRTAQSNQTLGLQNAVGKQSSPHMYHSISTGRNIATSSHVNYIQPIASSMYVNIRKSDAVGKSSYKVGLPLNAPITTKNYNVSSTRSSLRRARSGGCSAPAKKGSIYNTSLSNGQVCAWGSLPRQTY